MKREWVCINEDGMRVGFVDASDEASALILCIEVHGSATSDMHHVHERDNEDDDCPHCHAIYAYLENQIKH